MDLERVLSPIGQRPLPRRSAGGPLVPIAKPSAAAAAADAAMPSGRRRARSALWVRVRCGGICLPLAPCARLGRSRVLCCSPNSRRQKPTP